MLYLWEQSTVCLFRMALRVLLNDTVFAPAQEGSRKRLRSSGVGIMQLSFWPNHL